MAKLAGGSSASARCAAAVPRLALRWIRVGEALSATRSHGLQLEALKFSSPGLTVAPCAAATRIPRSGWPLGRRSDAAVAVMVATSVSPADLQVGFQVGFPLARRLLVHAFASESEAGFDSEIWGDRNHGT